MENVLRTNVPVDTVNRWKEVGREMASRAAKMRMLAGFWASMAIEAKISGENDLSVQMLMVTRECDCCSAAYRRAAEEINKIFKLPIETEVNNEDYYRMKFLVGLISLARDNFAHNVEEAKENVAFDETYEGYMVLGPDAAQIAQEFEAEMLSVPSFEEALNKQEQEKA